jgi:hypothetical protein
MKSKLTKRERALRTIRFEDVDRIAIYDILDNDGAIEYYAGEAPTPINGDRVKGKAIGRCLDMTRMPKGPQAERVYTDEDGQTWQVNRWTSWITKRPYRDFDEFVAWARRKVERLNAWQPDEAFVEAFHENIRRHLCYFAMGAEECEDLPILVIESPVGPDRIYTRCGLEMFTQLMFNEPELMDEWIEAQNQAEIRRAHAIADPELIPVVLTHDDIASKNGPFFNPNWIRQYEIPRLKRLVEAWHQHDTYCLFHSDGNLMPILDDLVGTGIDGMNPMETVAGMSIPEVRKRHPRLFLTGGIDVSQLLPNGTVEEVRARCLEAIGEADGKGYFLGSTTEILPSVPTENVVAMLETPKNLAAVQV